MSFINIPSFPTSLLSGQIFVGNAGNVPAAVSMGGAATIDANGVLTLTTAPLSFPLLAPNGTHGAPSYSSSLDSSTGFYFPSAGTIGVAGVFAADNGTAANPTYGFASASGLGIYDTGGSVGISHATVEVLDCSVGGVTTGAGVDFATNTLSPLDPTSTTGYLFVAVSSGGAPTGVPANGNGATFFDSATNKFYIYNGGWKSVTLS